MAQAEGTWWVVDEGEGGLKGGVGPHYGLAGGGRTRREW